jgi:hypothetical protein
LPARPAVILDVMDDMQRETTTAEDSSTPTVDRTDQPAAAVVQAARLLANPRRVRRA